MLSMLAAAAGSVRAANVTWTGAVDDLWSTAGNWTPAGVPAGADMAVFPSTDLPRTISLGGGVTITSVAITPSAYTFGAGGPGTETLTLLTGGYLGLTDSGPGTPSNTLAAAIVLGTNANASTQQIYASGQDSTLTVAGPVRGGTGGTAGTKALTLNSSKALRDSTIVVDGVIGGGGGTLSVTKSGEGRLVLNGNNTFTGPLTLRNGTTSIGVFNNANTDGPLGHSTTAVAFARDGSANPALEYTGGTAGTTKPLSLANAGVNLTVTEAATELTLNGIVSGAGGVLGKSGPGTLVLAAANTQSFGTSVTEGTVRLSGTGTFGAAPAELTVLGGVAELNSHSVTLGYLAGEAAGTVANNGPTDCTLTANLAASTSAMRGRLRDTTGATAGKLSLTKSGTGTLQLTDDNSYSGPTQISAGVVVIRHPNALGAATSGTTVASGATLEVFTDSAEPITCSGTGAAGEGGALLGFNEKSLTGPVTLAAATTFTTFPYGPKPRLPFLIAGATPITGNFALTLAGSSEGEIAGVVGTGSLVKNGTGQWILSGPNTYSGATTVSAGILTIRNAAALGATTTGTSITAGATLQIDGGVTTLAEPLTVRGAGDAGGTGAVESLSGTNTYAGLLTLGADSTIASDAGLIVFSHAGNIGGAGFDLTLTGGGDGRIDSVIATGAGLVNKAGAGTWKLAGSNTYTGRTSVTEGLLEISTLKNVGGGASSLGAPATAANGTVALGATGTTGGLRFTGPADVTSNRVINLAGTTGGAVLDSSSATNARMVLTSALTATGLGDKTLVLTGTGTGGNELSGAIVNSAGFKTSVEKRGEGSWTLSGTNTYTGPTRVTGGTLTLTRAGLADASDVEMADGGVLHLAFAGSDAVARLFIDGIQQSAGTWGGPASGAAHKSSHFAGTGVLSVGTGPALEPYASWIGGYGITGPPAAFASDADGDGLSNALEWVLGGNPASPATGPYPTLVPAPGGGWTLSFSRNDASESGATLRLSRSVDLLVWSDLIVGAATFTDAASGIGIGVTENGASADAIVVTFPATPGPFFLRLKITAP